MKKITSFVFIVLLIVFNACRQGKEHPGGIEHVVLIGLDGLSTWGLQVVQTPCINAYYKTKDMPQRLIPAEKLFLSK